MVQRQRLQAWEWLRGQCMGEEECRLFWSVVVVGQMKGSDVFDNERKIVLTDDVEISSGDRATIE